ncbi:MAG: hypothetical protein KAS32_24890 [Candidatus Peribacteraceae bacterium]|nr:hypothetical protein [Candidatus Peribacteraceae bacterium]
MDKLNLTLSEAGSLMLGAGLLKLTTDLNSGMLIVIVGAVIKITVAVLNKKGVVVGSRKA